MSDSRRQKIVDAIVDRMKLINGSGVYETDIGSRVKDSETNWAQDQSTLPAISVFDGTAEAMPTSTGKTLSSIHMMPVLIKGYTVQGTSAANARKLIKDIKTAIRVDDKWHVSNVQLAMQTHEKSDSVARSEDTYELEGCEVEIMVQFQTDKFNAE